MPPDPVVLDAGCGDGARTLAQLREAGFTDLRTATATDPLGSSTEFGFATR